MEGPALLMCSLGPSLWGILVCGVCYGAPGTQIKLRCHRCVLVGQKQREIGTCLAGSGDRVGAFEKVGAPGSWRGLGVAPWSLRRGWPCHTLTPAPGPTPDARVQNSLRVCIMNLEHPGLGWLVQPQAVHRPRIRVGCWTMGGAHSAPATARGRPMAAACRSAAPALLVADSALPHTTLWLGRPVTCVHSPLGWPLFSRICLSPLPIFLTFLNLEHMSTFYTSVMIRLSLAVWNTSY